MKTAQACQVSCLTLPGIASLQLRCQNFLSLPDFCKERPACRAQADPKEIAESCL